MYNKHGKCLIYYNKQFKRDILTPEDYLRKAADLAVTYNMGQYLRKFHTKKDHNINDISDEIRKNVKVTPYIHFLRKEKEEGSTLSVDQIYLYFDQNFQLMDSKLRTPNESKISFEHCIRVRCPDPNNCSEPSCKILSATFPLPSAGTNKQPTNKQ